MRLCPLILACIAVLLGGCASGAASGGNLDAGLRRGALEGVKKRNAQTEFEAGLRKGRMIFYSTGSLMEGYSLPGLTKEEVAIVESQPHEIANEFPTDPVPLWATQEYWDAVERFASEYNRLAYRHLLEKKSNKSSTAQRP